MRKRLPHSQPGRGLDGDTLGTVRAANGVITKLGPKGGGGPVGLVGEPLTGDELDRVIGGNGVITKLGPKGPGPVGVVGEP